MMPSDPSRTDETRIGSRLWDLVRFMRSELLDAKLITREEYAYLLTEETKDAPGQGSPSPRRLESYDSMRAALTRLQDAHRAQEERIKELEKLRGEIEYEVGVNHLNPGIKVALLKRVLAALPAAGAAAARKETR